MTRRDVLIATVWFVSFGVALASAQDAPSVRVAIETEHGTIEVEVDVARSPRTSTNFLGYVDDGFYDGGQFHRTVTMANQPDNDVKIEVIQASIDAAHQEEQRPAIELERTTLTGLAHTDGAISMARSGADTATSSFFICIGDQPSLDFGGARNADGQGFAAFGRVVSGMDVVRVIQTQPADAQRLDPPVGIVRVSRLSASGDR